jgi:GNAT superfamily N-acetyltransferase
MTNGEAREIHSSRPLSERLEDEASTEVLTTDFQEWLSNPKKFDMPHTDEKAPLRFAKEEKRDPETGYYEGKIVAVNEIGREVGYINYTRSKHALKTESIRVYPRHKGKGYGVFLLREIINMADGHCLQSKLVPWPYIHERIPGKSEQQKMENWRNRVDFLLKLYGSFGFKLDPEFTPDDCKDFGECSMTRPPVCEEGKHDQW